MLLFRVVLYVHAKVAEKSTLFLGVIQIDSLNLVAVIQVTGDD